MKLFFIINLLLLLIQPLQAEDFNFRKSCSAMGVQLPKAPNQSYHLPNESKNTTRSVSSTYELQEILKYNPQYNEEPLDIILEDGVYTAAGLDSSQISYAPAGHLFLRLWGSHRLYARHSGKVFLRFGIIIGGNHARYEEGAEFHGLNFYISNPVYAAIADRNNPERTAALTFFGNAKNITLSNLRFYGANAIQRGIEASQPDGLNISRVKISSFMRYGLFIDSKLPILQQVNLSDISVSHIGTCYNCATEHVGVWLGASVSAKRLKILNVSRVGLLTGGSLQGGLIEDVYINKIGTNQKKGVGIYIDNTTKNTVFNRFCVGKETRIGVNSEWDNCSIGSDSVSTSSCFSRGVNNWLGNGVIASQQVGVFMDQGTQRPHLSNLIIRNAHWAGVGFYNTNDESYNNLDIQLAPEVCDITKSHINTVPADCASSEDFVLP